MNRVFLIPLFLVLFACGEASKDPNKEANTAAPTSQNNDIIAEAQQLPSITQEMMTQLYNSCDYIDFVFYELSFSMSFDNKNAIGTALNWISPTVPILVKNCKSLGRMVFQGNGEIIMEAEMIVSNKNECGHFVWIIDGERKYANRLNADGKKYFLGLINQNLKR